MTEVVGVEPVGAHDPAPPQLVEPADERLLVETAGVGQDRAGELAPDRRGDARQLVRRPGEPRQPRGDHRLDPVAVAAFRAGLDGLDEEERVALGLGEQALGLGLAEPLPHHPLGEQVGLAAAQPFEPDLRAAAERLQPGGQLGDRMSRVDLLAPRGRRDQQRRRRLRAQQVVQELERRRRRTSAGRRRPGAAAPREPAAPGRAPRRGAGAARPRAWVRAAAPSQLRQQPAQLGEVGRIEAVQPRRQWLRAQPGDDGPERDGAFRGIRARVGADRAGVLAPRPQLLDQPALADAGLARHEHELGAATPGRAPERGEPRALAPPADERRPGRRGRAAPRGGPVRHRPAAAPRTPPASSPTARRRAPAARSRRTRDRPAARALGRRARRGGASAPDARPRAADRREPAARRSGSPPPTPRAPRAGAGAARAHRGSRRAAARAPPRPSRRSCPR